MRLMILVAGAALTLTACGGNKTQNDAANTSADSNMMTTDSTMMDANMTSDANMMGGNSMDTNAVGGADGNMATNAATENVMKQKDLNTHDPDTNLKNGL